MRFFSASRTSRYVSSSSRKSSLSERRSLRSSRLIRFGTSKRRTFCTKPSSFSCTLLREKYLSEYLSLIPGSASIQDFIMRIWSARTLLLMGRASEAL